MHWMVLAACFSFLGACVDSEKSGDSGASVGDSGSGDPPLDLDQDADTDADTDTDTDADPYTTYDGWESLDYNDGAYPQGEYNCQLVWWATGTPVDPIPSECEGCDFVFDVYLSYDPSVGFDDGTCETIGDYEFTYASSGDDLLVGYDGIYEYRADATFDGSQFVYSTGYKDYAYHGDGYIYYYTLYLYGAATVE